jgi:bile acid:Na+ symporter, BASS family
MSPQEIVGFALKSSIMLTLFGFGLQATLEDVLFLVRRPRLLVRSLVAIFVVMPLFAILMTKIFSFNSPVVIALIVLSISPIPPLLPKKVTKSGGRASYELGLMVTAAAFSIVFIPLATYLLGKYFDRPFAMGPSAVAKVIVLSVLLPLAAGIVFRSFAPGAAERIAGPLVRFAGVVLLIGVLCILAFALPTAWSLVGDGTILAFISVVIVGLAVGHLLGGPDPDERVALALSTACRHPGLAIAIAGVNIPNEHRVVSAVLLYVITNVLFTIPYVAWQRKKLREVQPLPNARNWSSS